MYSIFIDQTKIFDDTKPNSDWKMTEPVLTLEKGSAGSLEFVLSPGAIGYDLIREMIPTVRVYKNTKPGISKSDGQTWLWNEPIWQGRILSITKDFFNRKKVHCEGALAFLNDTTQETKTFSAGTTLQTVFDTIIINHNSKYQKLSSISAELKLGREFILTGIAPSDVLYSDFECSYESTLETLNKLVDEYGGWLHTTFKDGTNYISWYNDENGVFNTTQEINFGRNLFDYTNETSYADFSTVCIPHGSRYTNVVDGEEVDAYYNCYGYNVATGHRERGECVISDAASEYGWIEKVVDFDGVENPETLYNLGVLWLATTQYETMTVEISALDLKILSPNDSNVEPIDICDNVRCYSKPHNVDITLPVTKLEIRLDDVTSAKYTLNGQTQKTLSATSAKVSSTVEEITGGSSSIVKRAQDSAAERLLNATSGYITIVQSPSRSGKRADAIYISDTQDYETAPNKWVWNMQGWGFIKNNSTTTIAANMDGQLVANAIKAGTICGVDINARNITVGGSAFLDRGVSCGNGKIEVKNSSDKTIVNVNTNGITTDTADGYRLAFANGEITAYNKNNNNVVGRINFINTISGGSSTKPLLTLSSTVAALDTDELCVKHQGSWWGTLSSSKLPFIKSATLEHDGNKVTLKMVYDGLIIEKGIIIGTTGEQEKTSSVTITSSSGTIDTGDGGSSSGQEGGGSGGSSDLKPAGYTIGYSGNSSFYIYWYYDGTGYYRYDNGVKSYNKPKPNPPSGMIVIT